jgi:hypothetical protein
VGGWPVTFPAPALTSFPAAETLPLGSQKAITCSRGGIEDGGFAEGSRWFAQWKRGPAVVASVQTSRGPAQPLIYVSTSEPNHQAVSRVERRAAACWGGAAGDQIRC